MVDADLHPLAHEPVQQMREVRQNAARIERLEFQRLLAREGEKLADESRRALGVLADLLEIGPVGIVPAASDAQEVAMARDRGEEVVEVMRDPARELADRLHLLALHELRLERLELGRVVQHRDGAQAVRGLDARQVDLGMGLGLAAGDAHRLGMRQAAPGQGGVDPVAHAPPETAHEGVEPRAGRDLAAEEMARGAVGLLDDAARGEPQHGDGKVLEEVVGRRRRARLSGHHAHHPCPVARPDIVEFHPRAPVAGCGLARGGGLLDAAGIADDPPRGAAPPEDRAARRDAEGRNRRGDRVDPGAGQPPEAETGRGHMDRQRQPLARALPVVPRRAAFARAGQKGESHRRRVREPGREQLGRGAAGIRLGGLAAGEDRAAAVGEKGDVGVGCDRSGKDPRTAAPGGGLKYGEPRDEQEHRPAAEKRREKKRALRPGKGVRAAAEREDHGQPSHPAAQRAASRSKPAPVIVQPNCHAMHPRYAVKRVLPAPG